MSAGVTRRRAHRTIVRSIAAAVLLAAMAGTAVAGSDGTSGGQSAEPATTTRSPVPPPCRQVGRFEARLFSAPFRIDNVHLPLVPGTRVVLEGEAGLGAHEVILTVTDLTKVINGIRTLVVWDNDYQEGVLAESELAFFAQDDLGNVWSVGEYPEEYDAGVLVGAPSTWIAGLAGAVPGLAMPAAPRLGTGWYLQGWVPDIDFLDCAKVFLVDQRICVPVACYEDVLVVDERSPLDPTSGSQRKYFAPGVGNVQIGAVGDRGGETLVVTSLTELGEGGLAAARAAAIEMDARGHAVSEVYGQTAPLEPVPGS